MAFKDSPFKLEIVDIALIDPDPRHIRKNLNSDSLKGLSNAIQKLGLIHPILVRPADDGRYVVIAGERRRLAALEAGETSVPAIIRTCSEEESLEIQVFENIGLGVRSALEARDMANAIRSIATRFQSSDEAAQYFGRPPTWLAQATAAANLSEKVTALLDAGKISSTGAAVQLEKLAKKNEAKAESVIEQIEQSDEGEKLTKKVVDNLLSQETARTRHSDEPTAVSIGEIDNSVTTADTPFPPWEDSSSPEIPHASPATHLQQGKVNPGKIKLVAELLGLNEEDEETLLARLIDEFLATRNH